MYILFLQLRFCDIDHLLKDACPHKQETHEKSIPLGCFSPALTSVNSLQSKILSYHVTPLCYALICKLRLVVLIYCKTYKVIMVK